MNPSNPAPCRLPVLQPFSPVPRNITHAAFHKTTAFFRPADYSMFLTNCNCLPCHQVLHLLCCYACKA